MRKKCAIETATYEDLEHVTQNLRDEDRREITAFLEGEEVEGAIRDSYEKSTLKWCLTFRGIPTVLAGVVAASEKVGRPWLVATHNLNHRVPVRRHLALVSREYLMAILQQFDFLYNWISFGNAFTVSWLAWLGFVLSPDYSMLRGGVQFLYAYYVKEKE